MALKHWRYCHLRVRLILFICKLFLDVIPLLVYQSVDDPIGHWGGRLNNRILPQ